MVLCYFYRSRQRKNRNEEAVDSGYLNPVGQEAYQNVNAPTTDASNIQPTNSGRANQPSPCGSSGIFSSIEANHPYQNTDTNLYEDLNDAGNKDFPIWC